MPHYEATTVPVPGGLLHVGMWGRRGPVIVASHGLTATHVGFAALAEQLGDDFRLITPDHRGRGKSRDITGPWGLAAHVEDLVAILDHLGLAQADVLVGHSMGGFVAAIAAATYPDRFSSVLMIDGGLPIVDVLPNGVTTEQLMHAVVGPAIQRLDMHFASLQDYRDFWRSHPAFADDWSVYVERYVDYDLIGAPPTLSSGVNKDAVLSDAESQLTTDIVPKALEMLQQPVWFLRASRGMLNGDPLYTEAVVAEFGNRLPIFQYSTVADVNHYTIVISKRGACALVDRIRYLIEKP